MPIWLRRITFNLIKEHYDKQNEEAERHQNTLKNKGKTSLAKPNVAPPNPTYTTKRAPKE